MNTEYKRFEGETDNQLVFRICQDKDKIGTWQDVADILNELTGNVYGESAYRKKYQDFNKVLDANQEHFTNTQKQIERLEQLKTDIQKERYKLQAEKIGRDRVRRQESRFELLYENVRNAMQVLEPPVFKYSSAQSHGTSNYVVGFGDVHFGSTFESDNNSYSREECKNRFKKLLNSLVEFVIAKNIGKLTIINVGDDIQGLLRVSDLQMNDTDIVMCVVEISQIIAEFLNKLSEFCEIDYYHCCYSNHTQTRNLGTKASVLAGEDLEKIICNYISDVLVDNTKVQVNFDVGKEYIDFNIGKYQCTMEHGHRVRNIKSYLHDKSVLRHKMYDYAFLGHTHSAQEIIAGETKDHNLEILVVPSFIGSDPYADTLNVGSKSMVKIYEFNEDLGGHVGSYNIILN